MYFVLIVYAAGDNFAWPCIVGPGIHDGDDNHPNEIDFAISLGQNIVNVEPTVLPTLTYHHVDPTYADFTGNCIVSASPYLGTRYPARYQGDPTNRAVFVADFGQGWIRVIWVDENDNMIPEKGVQEFWWGMGPITMMKPDPVTGDMFVSIINNGNGGILLRLMAVDTIVANQPPMPIVSATPDAGTH